MKVREPLIKLFSCGVIPILLGVFLTSCATTTVNTGRVRIKDFVGGTAAREDAPSCKDCNLIFISLTNLRVDHLGFSGYLRNTSPNLDVFARDAVVFDNAFSVASWTLPAAMSVFTSQYPFTHKVMVRYDASQGGQRISRSHLSKEALTLVDILNENGYETASVNSAKDYLPLHGLTDRFRYNVSLKTDDSKEWGQYGSIYDVTPKALEWLERNHNKKFFLHIQAYDTHCPFAYPKENDMFDPAYKGDVTFESCYWTFDKTEPIILRSEGHEKKYYNVKTAGKNADPLVPKWMTDPDIRRLDERDIEHMVALYDGEIFNCDTQLARIFKKLKQLGLTKNTVIVFFSEHGDMFGKYGRFMRGGPLRGTLYDDVLHVPLAIYHPHLTPRRIKNLVSLIDITPTVLDFLGIRQPRGFEGTSLVPLLEGEMLPPPKMIFAGALYTPPAVVNTLFNHSTIIAAVRDEGWKLIRETMIYRSGDTKTDYELFNIKDDPEELNNRAGDKFQKLEELNIILNGWIESEVGLDELLKSAYNKKRGEE